MQDVADSNARVACTWPSVRSRYWTRASW
jgi:hypothetical protein